MSKVIYLHISHFKACVAFRGERPLTIVDPLAQAAILLTLICEGVSALIEDSLLLLASMC